MSRLGPALVPTRHLRLMNETHTGILCIDDEEPGLSLRRCVLEKAGYRVFTAATGKEGISIFRHQPIDVVILDYWMADMHGLKVATELQAIKRKPIIMLSGYAPILDEGLGIVDLWLLKGESDPAQLLSAVAELLNRELLNR
jgi:CheY-like chemotaxis protein